MPGFFQYGNNIANWSGTIELDCGNDAFSDPMIKVFKEDECPSPPRDRKRVGIAPRPWIRKNVPARPG